jgi:pimeloyl-ACP methyl ester carboxylesterase
MAKFKIFILLLLLSFFFCKTAEDKALSELQDVHADISAGYFGDVVKIYFVSSSCLTDDKGLLVFMHGSPGSWQDYKKYLLSDKLRSRFCIVSIDRPGYGNSSSDKNYPDVMRQASLIHSALSDFSIRMKKLNSPTVYVGHSYGGPIAAVIGAMNDKKQNHLVLISAPMDPDLEEVKWFNLLADLKLIKWILPADLIHSNDEMLPLKSQLFELSQKWKLQNVSVLIVHGKNDFLVDFENLNYMKKHIRNNLLKTVELEDENHFIPWTKFDLVVKNIMELK